MTFDFTRAIQRAHIRKTMRQIRRKLSVTEQNRAAQSLVDLVLLHSSVASSHRIGLFLSFDGEINTVPLIHALWYKGKQVYLPQIHPFNSRQLLFLEYTPNMQLIPGKFGIFTPPLTINSILSTHELDIVFTPLVAFDRRGYRLGMGGGFYDRTLAAYTRFPFKPIGLAYHMQEIDCIPKEHWDVPLPEIITEKEHIICISKTQRHRHRTSGKNVS